MLNLWSFSLIEQDMAFGDTMLTAGDLLFSQKGRSGVDDNDVYVFHTVDALLLDGGAGRHRRA